MDEKVKAGVTNEKSAIVLMLEKTSVIKRPLIEKNEKVIALGFDEDTYIRLFKK